jgi:hypothetical protein
MTESKNADWLRAFTEYCTAHPEQRGWQSLRNWSGYAFIYGQKEGGLVTDPRLQDTFFKE